MLKMNFLGLLLIIAVIWFVSTNRTKWRHFVTIVVGILFVFFQDNAQYSGDTACIGIALIVGGAFWFFIYSGADENVERSKKK